MSWRTQLGMAVAALVAPFVILFFAWAGRTEPQAESPCGRPGPPAVLDAWLAGLRWAALATGVICLVVVRWASVRRGDEPPDIRISGALVAGLAWFLLGDADVFFLWAMVAFFLALLSPLVFTALLGLVFQRAARGQRAKAWSAVVRLGWWCALVVVPAFVAVVEGAGSADICMS